MWIPIAFIAFLTIVSVVGTIAGSIVRTTKKKAELELIRLVIEKGQTLDPELLDKLMPVKARANAPTPEEISTGLQIGGIMGFAFAVGLVVLGYFLSGIADANPKTFPALQGAGGLFFCLSVGLFVASKVVRSKSKSADNRA
jgi:hypothetical protein